MPTFSGKGQSLFTITCVMRVGILIPKYSAKADTNIYLRKIKIMLLYNYFLALIVPKSRHECENISKLILRHGGQVLAPMYTQVS